MATPVRAGGANRGVNNLTGQFGQFGNFASRQTVYVTPSYLVRAAKRKYGSNIIMIGAVESALKEFWDTVANKLSGSQANKNLRPVEDSRIIVDISAKEHCNFGNDVDKVEITTNKEETRSEKKAYSLSFGKQSGWEYGGGLNIGASFFNTASASLGISGKRTKGKWKSEEEDKEEERSLSQGYGVVGKIEVPAKTKASVKITTYAVTYTTNVKIVISAPSTSYIPFYYKKYLGNLFCAGGGSCCRKFGFVNARELFQNETEFQDLGHSVQFTRDSQLSYIGEVVEMYKEETPLSRH